MKERIAKQVKFLKERLDIVRAYLTPHDEDWEEWIEILKPWKDELLSLNDELVLVLEHMGAVLTILQMSAEEVPAEYQESINFALDQTEVQIEFLETVNLYPFSFYMN